VVWFGFLLVAIFLTLPLAAFLGQAGPDRKRLAYEDFGFGNIRLPHTYVELDGFTTNNSGFVLSGGGHGRLLYRIDKPAGTRLDTELWFYAAPGIVSNQVDVAVDGGPPMTVARDTNYNGAPISLPPEVTRGSTIDLIFTAANSGDSDRLVLDQLVWAAWTGSPVAPPGGLGLIGLGLLCALIVIAMVPGKRGRFAGVGFGLVVALAAWLRFHQLPAAAAKVLDPDAITYRVLADHFHYWPLSQGIFCGCYSMREPFYIGLLRVVFDLFGESDYRLRVVSSVFSVLAVGLVVLAARRRLSWPVALAIGFVMALNGPFIDESVRGLRTELETVELIFIYYITDRGPSARPWLDAILTALTGAVAVLTRTYYLAMVVLVAAISFLTRYRPWTRAVVLVVVVALAVGVAEVGHRTGLYNTYHDAQYDSFVEGRSWANIEKFDYHRNLLHPELFPTAEDVATKGYLSGPYLTYGQYLFELHPPREVIADTLLGYWDIAQSFDGFLRIPDLTLPPPFGRGVLIGAIVDFAVRWLGIFGMGLMILAALRRPRDVILPLLVGSALVVQAFLYHRGMLERYRLTIEVYPLVMIAAGYAIETGLKRLGIKPEAALAALPSRLRALITPATLASAVAVISAATVVDTSANGPSLYAAMVITVAALAVAAWFERRVATLALLGVLVLVGPRLGATAALATAGVMLVRTGGRMSSLVPLWVLLPAIAVTLISAITHRNEAVGFFGAVETAAIVAGLAVSITLAWGHTEDLEFGLRSLALAGLPLALVAIGLSSPTAPSLGSLSVREPAVMAALLLLPVLAAAGLWLAAPRAAAPLATLLLGTLALAVVGNGQALIGFAVGLGWLLLTRARSVRSVALLAALLLLALGLSVTALRQSSAGSLPSITSAEQGLAGVLAMLFALVGAGIAAYRVGMPAGPVLLAALLAVGVAMLGESLLADPHAAVIFWTAAALPLGALGASKPPAL